MKKIAAVLFLLSALYGNSQYVISDGSELLALQRTPLERIFMHHTGAVLFPGEYLNYSVHVMNAQSGRTSTISKIAYVLLVDKDGDIMFEHKLKLEKGMAEGDFFIPSELRSGNYKLIAYTNWIRNAGIDQFFQDDVVIINPYLANQSEFLGQNGEPSNMDADLRTIVSDSATLELQTDKVNYGTRALVKLSLKNYKSYLGNGTYHISVAQKNNFTKKGAKRAVVDARNAPKLKKAIDQKVGDSIFLPEQRGELIFGRVFDKENGKPVPNITTVITMPGQEFLLKFANTNESGTFYSYLRKDYKVPTPIVQPLNDSLSVNLVMGAKNPPELGALTFRAYNFSSDYKDLILERSIQNQVENQFFKAKPDSILLKDPIDSFDGGIPEIVLLDEYTRFPTLEETLVEIVENVGFRRNSKYGHFIRVAQDFERYDEDFNSFPSIVLIDGVFIPNPKTIRDFDATLIERIRVVRDQFQMGGGMYQGIVSIETFDNDFYETYEGKNMSRSDLKPLFPVKNYFKQKYDEPNNVELDRIPDYRRVLFWQPNIVVDGNNYEYEFFTSDLSGDFEIVLEGYTTYGKPISLKKTISVGLEP